MPIFTNISWSKSNQTMKFDQVIEYNMRNTFLERSYTKCREIEKLLPHLFLKSQIWAYLWINSLKFFKACFYCMFLQLVFTWNILKQSYKPLAFTSSKTFLKNKERSGTSLPVSFFVWFLKINIFLLYSINWPNFIAWLHLLCEI